MGMQRTLIGVATLAWAGFATANAQTPDQDIAGVATSEEEIVVTAARTSLPASALPSTIEVIGAERLNQQAQLTGSAVDVVSTLIPSFSPTREKLTGQGESLRGRRPLFLIDGVPQSNPLRDGGREGYTIDPFFVDRVEVIFGSNAIQGIGATGGVVNYVTASAPRSQGAWTGRVMAQVSAANEFQGDGHGARTGALAGRDFGVFDLTVGAAAQWRGAFYSGDGRRIGIEGTQGEIQDSTSLSLFLKAGLDVGPDRRLELMAQQFELDGDGDYVLVPGSRTLGIPASATRGRSPGVVPTNTVRTISATWRDESLFGGTLTGQVYRQDFESVFGGGIFPDFQDPRIRPGGGLFDQSSNNSDKTGLRLGYERELDAIEGLRFLAGVDVLRDETFQELIATGRKWVPLTTFTSTAPFLQAYQTLWSGRVTLAAGVRHERAQLEVGDYETLFFYGPQQVSGGTPEFEETLTNAGLTVDLTDSLSAYASYAQGFTMPDVGRILRAVNRPGQDVDTFLDLDPVVTDNTEIGLEWNGYGLSGSLAWFRSNSDKGALLVLRTGDIFEVQRQRTEIEGIEVSARWDLPVEGLALSAGYAAVEGRTDGNGDGRVDQDLDGANISPDRLNLAIDLDTGPWSLRLQNQRYLERSFAGVPTAGRFGGYDVVDGFARYAAGFGDVTLSVANLFDTQYITYNSQVVRPTDSARFFAGRGRVISVGVERRF
jgi:iron complex outermembrane receptor protein